MKPSLDRNVLLSIVDYAMMHSYNLRKNTSDIIYEEFEKWDGNYNNITEIKVVIHFIDNYE